MVNYVQGPFEVLVMELRTRMVWIGRQLEDERSPIVDVLLSRERVTHSVVTTKENALERDLIRKKRERKRPYGVCHFTHSRSVIFWLKRALRRQPNANAPRVVWIVRLDAPTHVNPVAGEVYHGTCSKASSLPTLWNTWGHLNLKPFQVEIGR